MPRGIYNRTKVTKTLATKKATRTQTYDRSLDQYLYNINSCVDILAKLPLSGVTSSAREGLYVLINHMVKQAVPTVVGEKEAQELAAEVKEELSAGKVLYQTTPPPTPREVFSSSLGSVATGPVKFKKDGTPKKRPGPKPKNDRVEASTGTNSVVTSSNGNSDVFNPEHAS